jgi:hypothetical protein
MLVWPRLISSLICVLVCAVLVGPLSAEGCLSAGSFLPAEGCLSAEGCLPAEGRLSAEGSVSHAVGIARDASSLRVSYIEHHQGLPSGAQRIDYYRADLTPIAYKLLAYPGKPQHPSIEQENFALGTKSRVSPSTDDIKMWRSEAGEVTSTSLPASDGLIVDAGFDAFIKANWGSLLDKPARRVEFVAAGSARTLKMRLNVEESDESGLVKFSITPSSWLVRMFLPSLSFFYDQRRSLQRYEGYSNFVPPDSDSQQVVVEFTYYETASPLRRPRAAWLLAPLAVPALSGK